MWRSRGAAVVDTWLEMENYCHITQSHQLPWLIDNMHYILYVHLGDGQPTMYMWLIYCSSQLHKQCIVYIHSKLCPSSNMHEIGNDGFIHWSTLTLPITVYIHIVILHADTVCEGLSPHPSMHAGWLYSHTVHTQLYTNMHYMYVHTVPCIYTCLFHALPAG